MKNWKILTSLKQAGCQVKNRKLQSRKRQKMTCQNTYQQLWWPLQDWKCSLSFTSTIVHWTWFTCFGSWWRFCLVTTMFSCWACILCFLFWCMNSFSFMLSESQLWKTQLSLKDWVDTCNGQWETECLSKSSSTLPWPPSSWCHTASTLFTALRNMKMRCWTSSN